MSDTQHTPGLVLTARIESKNSRHAHIGVFQNGGKAGVLCVNIEYAEQIIGLIAAAPDLLATCEAVMEKQADAASYRLPCNCEAVKLVRAAIDKATGKDGE